jgi:phosphate transport system protein
MRNAFNKDLASLMERLLGMASVAEKMIHLSIQALVQRDASLVEKIPEMEAEVNHFELEIDNQANRLLCLQQPLASDLRFIVASMKIGGDLERIGDQAVNITENTQILLQQPELNRLIDLPHMAEIVKEMVRDSLHAFITSDASEARAVLLRDDAVDALKDQVFRVVLTYMISDPKTIPIGIQLILISRHLERVADHATNIAEDVVYLVEAKDIRHHAEDSQHPSPSSNVLTSR